MKPSITNVREDSDFFKLKPLSRISGGIGINYSMSESANIGIGFEGNQVGTYFENEFRDENNELVGLIDTKWLASYLTIPVTYQYRFGSNLNWRFKGGVYSSLSEW